MANIQPAQELAIACVKAMIAGVRMESKFQPSPKDVFFPVDPSRPFDEAAMLDKLADAIASTMAYMASTGLDSMVISWNKIPQERGRFGLTSDDIGFLVHNQVAIGGGSMLWFPDCYDSSEMQQLLPKLMAMFSAAGYITQYGFNPQWEWATIAWMTAGKGTGSLADAGEDELRAALHALEQGVPPSDVCA